MIRLFTKRTLILEFQALTTHDDPTCHYNHLSVCFPSLSPQSPFALCKAVRASCTSPSHGILELFTARADQIYLAACFAIASSVVSLHLHVCHRVHTIAVLMLSSLQCMCVYVCLCDLAFCLSAALQSTSCILTQSLRHK